MPENSDIIQVVFLYEGKKIIMESYQAGVQNRFTAAVVVVSATADTRMLNTHIGADTVIHLHISKISVLPENSVCLWTRGTNAEKVCVYKR